MRIIEIAPLENGAHRNQSGSFRTIPAGWAVVPDALATENFPFGEIEVERIEGVWTVTAWTPGVMPEPVPEPEPEPTLDDRVTAIETAIADGLKLYEEDLSNA